ncbi:hypothetical protein Tco_0328042 [Tanacetum coccineum]
MKRKTRAFSNPQTTVFYDKLNALKFVPQQELSREQAYWLPANERASQTSNPNSHVTPFVHKSRPPIPQSEPVFEILMLVIDTPVPPMQIFEINKLRNQLKGKKDTNTRELDAQSNIMKVLNVGPLKLDGLKVENVSLKRRYDELSQANTHSRTANTEKLSALTAENTKLKAQVTGKTSSGPSTSETPKCLLPNVQLRDSVIIDCLLNRNPSGSYHREKFLSYALVQIVLWYLDSGCSRHMTGDRARLINFFIKVPLVPQLDLATMNMQQSLAMFACLQKPLSERSHGLWQSLVESSNFGTMKLMLGTILVRRITHLNIQRPFVLPSCQLGKSKKASHPLKTENTNTEVLNTLHMDLCGPMRTKYQRNKEEYFGDSG